MPALIDNYITEEPSLTNYAEPRYSIVFEREYSSTVISHPSRIGLNHRISNLLNEYSQLDDNWDEDDALAPEKDAINRAKYLSSLLEKHGQPIFHVAPGPNGEIMLDIRNRNNSKSLEIILYSEHTVAVLFPLGRKPTQRDFNFQMLPEVLSWLNEE